MNSLLNTCILYIRKNPSLFDHKRLPTELVIKFFKLHKIEKLLRNKVKEIDIFSVSIDKYGEDLFFKINEGKGITRPTKLVYFEPLVKYSFGQKNIFIDYTFHGGEFYIQQSFDSTKCINYFDMTEEYLPYYDKKIKKINIRQINNILNLKYYIYSNLDTLNKFSNEIIAKVIKPSIIENKFYKTKFNIYWCINDNNLIIKFNNDKLECECTKYKCYNCEINKLNFINYGNIPIYKNWMIGSYYILNVLVKDKQLIFVEQSFNNFNKQIYVGKNFGILKIDLI